MPCVDACKYQSEGSSHSPLKLIFGRQARRDTVGGPFVLGLAGSTCGGKSSLAKNLRDELGKAGLHAVVIGQDKHYKSPEEVRILPNSEDPPIRFYHYDEIEALNETAMLAEIQTEKSRSADMDVLIVEGNLITESAMISAQLHCTVFLTIDKETCRQRRTLRIYDPPDEIGYFEQVVWPCYERILERAKKSFDQRKLAFIQSTEKHIPLEELIINFQHLLSDCIELSREELSADAALKWIASPSCGANSLFVGTTRDTFEGKRVTRLEYEAYDEMAYAELARLCREVRSADPNILRIYISHRIGCVPVGERSVVIGVSAPQRQSALAATKWLIDELKRRVPIWKKELYDDGTASWKENAC